ncbi:hypothetical protein [Sodalis-like endosymbiont of Proechinophthirus fluctus]|uniref:hypothetical protein n=1 Tax=Sodalis-like endosymbiont of Proechinophthirus fluctus TaxID=1462730 RepID=UPI000AEB1173|nr:hypothetical protein [Sodalis-like endosymbiont of Proechinophthirus fluctus]
MTSFDLGETIKFIFVDDGNGEMTVVEMLNYMFFHGTYYLGTVGWRVSECGAVLSKDVLTVLLKDHND